MTSAGTGQRDITVTITLTPSFTAPEVPRNQCYELVFEISVTDNQSARATDGVKISVVSN